MPSFLNNFIKKKISNFSTKKMKYFLRIKKKIGKILLTLPVIIGRILELLVVDILNEITYIKEKQSQKTFKKK